jgi:hypothetical protein
MHDQDVAFESGAASGSFGRHSKLLLCAHSGDASWESFVWSTLHTARHPRVWQICVLLECKDEDAPVTVLDPRLRRRNVRVEYSKMKSKASLPVKMTRRLAKRFVLGDENVVVIVNDVRVRLVPEWDEIVLSVFDNGVPRNGVLSCPTPDEQSGRARFQPCESAPRAPSHEVHRVRSQITRRA